MAGAGGVIASALIQSCAEYFPDCRLLGVSRQDRHSILERHQLVQMDMSQPRSITLLSAALQERDFQPDIVLACMGTLHSEQQGPEKRLQQLQDDWFYSSMRVNCLSHLHLAQAIEPLLNRQSRLRWLSLSAMVGSIADNRSGGWYSYRMSKAALNMGIKNLSLEWARRFPLACVSLIHPGTTDSALSQPFQRNIPSDRLYKADETAHRILCVLDQLEPASSGKFYNWTGDELLW